MSEILNRVKVSHGEAESGLSAVTIVELTYGIYRAKSAADRERRQTFTEKHCRDLMVHAVTLEIAQIAGKIEGEQAARGVSAVDLTQRRSALRAKALVRFWAE